MKNDKKMRASYQKKMDIRLKVVEEQILNDSLTNPLLKRAGELPDYYKDWLENSRLVAVIPALEADDPKSNSYYSVGTVLDGVENNNIRVSPVFMYINEGFYDLSEDKYDPFNKFFMFDTEGSRLYSYEKQKHSRDYHYIKKPDFEKIKQHMVDNPVVLFFKGCDDGHVGKRFKTKEDAMEYLQLIDVFEDVFDEDLQYHN